MTVSSYQEAARSSRFGSFARRCAIITGKPIAFILACLTIVAWAVTGPFCHFSDTWQLIINTSTTIITFLMVFLIQNGQNRDTAAIQVKLDELIRVTKGAHVALLDLEHLSDAELENICHEYQTLAARARARLSKGKTDTNVPRVHLESCQVEPG